jgi:hypothetical protein
MISSEYHSISIIPVFEVTGPGIVDPENVPSKLVCEQVMVVQLLTVTKSYPCSVSKDVKTNVIESAPVGAIIPDIVSLIW